MIFSPSTAFGFFVSFVSFVSFVTTCLPPTTGAAAADAPDKPKPKPEWRTTQPMAVPRGRTTAVHLTGQDLAPKEIRFDDPRISAKILKTEPLAPKTDEEKARGNAAVEVDVTAPADLPPGLYLFKLIHAGSDSPTGKLYIDLAIPEILEFEPNDSLRQPQILPPGAVAVMGKLDKEGVDVFQFSGQAGETWRVEVLAHRVGSPFEPILRLRDPHLTSVRVAVDQGEDCTIEYRLPADGPYLIELFDANNQAKSDFTYRLRVTRQPSAPASPPAQVAAKNPT